MKRKYYFPSVMLGIYGADLHKVVLNSVPVFWGKPLLYVNSTRIVDLIFSGGCLISLIWSFLTIKKNIVKFKNTIVITQVIILTILSIGMIQYGSEIATKNYLRYIGGNFLLFVSTIGICNTIKKMHILLVIWVFMSCILSIDSIYLAISGVNWQGGRAEYIPGTGIRTGYCCASSFLLLYIYSFTKTKYLKYLKYAFLALLFFSVVTSGSKGSFILLMGMFASYYIVQMKFDRNKIDKQAILSVSVFIFLALIIKISLSFFGTNGDVRDVLVAEDYKMGYLGRWELLKEYIMLGTKHLFLGSGIEASYSLKNRTHSVITAVFVQAGLTGLICYIIFAVRTIDNGWKTIIKTTQIIKMQSITDLSKALFLCAIFYFFKGEITGDIPNNRDVWYFAAILFTWQLNIKDYLKRKKQITMDKYIDY